MFIDDALLTPTIYSYIQRAIYYNNKYNASVEPFVYKVNKGSKRERHQRNYLDSRRSSVVFWGGAGDEIRSGFAYANWAVSSLVHEGQQLAYDLISEAPLYQRLWIWKFINSWYKEAELLITEEGTLMFGNIIPPMGLWNYRTAALCPMSLNVFLKGVNWFGVLISADV